MTKGKLVSFEGIEGVGKSTTIHSVKEYLEERGITVYCTREPGGTKFGELLRGILLNNKSTIYPEAELLLIFAIRNQHIREIIEPKLSQGIWVLCDRYIDASIAYQGFGKNVDLNKIQSLIESFTYNIFPDLTIFFDLKYELAKKRFPKNKKKDRFEMLDSTFFNKVYDGYMYQIKKDSNRICIIDANVSKNAVLNQITLLLEKKFSSLFK
ncbi:MAG: dTMP kinase [Gammaproteobacteria bacterium]|mgnify:CR=1 FL=1|tara:strand:+ start:221 stop:853 length:633 start_codon:yes stop_codon:yes gene_type:complete